MKIKENDVYKFRWNEESAKKVLGSDPYHCFDGQLKVVPSVDDVLYLVDTYWNIDNNETFTLEDALEKGTLEFVCNLDEIEPINKRELDYYADENLFDLSYQHRCYKKYYKRKGAKKSADKMRKVIENKISEKERKIATLKNDLEHLKNDLDKVKNEDIDNTYF